MLIKTLIIITLIFVTEASYASQWGEYIGTVVTEWIDNGRSMKLVKEFKFKDKQGKLWVAPVDSEIDGASIPRFAWSIIGGPFEGKYRNASVIHDVACNAKKEEWKLVHETFHDAMRASGVDETTAKIMYAAVYYFGPRWEFYSVKRFRRNFSEHQTYSMSTNTRKHSTEAVYDKDNNNIESADSYTYEKQARPIQTQPLISEYDFKNLIAKIERKNISLDQISKEYPDFPYYYWQGQ